MEDAFAVLAHPVRRELLARLSRGERRVTDLALDLPVSRSATSQHLRMMLTAGAVTERRDGRERYYSLRRDGLRDIDRWLAELDAFWAGSLDRLAAHLDGPA